MTGTTTRHMVRKPLALAVSAAMLALLATACGGEGVTSSSSGGGGGGDKTLRVAYQVIPNSAPIVKHEHWLEDEKIKVKWNQFDSGSDVNRAVASGSVDVGLAGSTLVANGIASGLDYEVPWIYDVIGKNEALVAQKNIKSIKDLVGKKVATPLGSTTQYSLIAALKDAGVDPSQVRIIDMKPPDAVAAFKRGSIDAAYIWNPTLKTLVDGGGKILVTSADMAAKGVVTADLGIVSKKFAKDHPDVVSAWLKAEDRGAQMIKTDPEKAAKIIGDEFSISPADARSQMKDSIYLTGEEQLGADYLGTKDAPGKLGDTLFKTAVFLKDNKIIDTVPSKEDFAKAVNPTYLQSALGK